MVNYRHVIHSLKKMPMALRRLVYRDALFPRAACRLAVTLLALAHEENCEAELAAAIDDALRAARLPDPDALQARFAPDPGTMPTIDVARPQLAGYGPLLGAGGAA